MAKPIPVFAFAFAAFAATALKTSVEFRLHEAESLSEDDLFLAMWRASARGRANLMVKIGVVDEGRPTAWLCERDWARSAGVDEFWLAQIVETGNGFSGALPGVSRLGAPSRYGRRIGFELRHILGWKLDVDAKLRAAVEPIPAGSPPPGAKILADLDLS